MQDPECAYEVTSSTEIKISKVYTKNYIQVRDITFQFTMIDILVNM